MVAQGRQGSPRFKGEPRDGWDELKPERSYLSHFPPRYSKSGHFPIEIPIKNEKRPPNLSSGSIILKIVLWAYFTITHAMLTLSRVAPSAVSKGRGGAHCAPPWFLRVLGGCGFNFWWQPHILLRLTPDKRIYNFRIPRTPPTHGLKKWLFEGVCGS